MGIENSKSSVGTKMAEESGQPTATVVICEDPKVELKIVTKPVIGLPWKRDVKYNYFWAHVYINGHEIEHKTPWCQAPREAMVDAIEGLANHLKNDLPYASDLFEGAHALYGHNERGYWVIPGTHDREDPK